MISDTTKANRPIVSVSAMPRNSMVCWLAAADGLRMAACR